MSGKSQALAEHVTLTDLLCDPHTSGIHEGSLVACEWNGIVYLGQLIKKGNSGEIISQDSRLPNFTSKSPHTFIKKIISIIEENNVSQAQGRSWSSVFLVEGNTSNVFPGDSKSLYQVRVAFAAKITFTLSLSPSHFRSLSLSFGVDFFHSVVH